MTSRRLTAVALAVVALLLTATPVQAQPVGEGEGRISAFQETDTGAQFVYSGVNLPSEAGLDVESVSATFTPDGGEPVDLPVEADVAATVERRVVLALDTSGSLGDDGIAAVREAAAAFVDQLPEGTEVGLVTFGRPAVPVLDPTADRAQVLGAIAELDRSGNTALYDAVVLATGMLTGQGSELILLMTDGRDENTAPGSAGSAASLFEAAAAVQGSGAALTAVAFGDAALEPLQQLADVGGGQAVVAADDSEALTNAFEGVAQAIATELLVQATVPPELLGQPGTLRVQAGAGDLTVSAARAGAIGEAAAPPPPPPPTEAEPSPPPSEAAAPLGPRPAALDVIPAAVLYLAVGAMFLALLLVSAVLVGLLVRRNSPEAARARSLAVYSLRGSSPTLLSQEATQTRLGDSAVARSAVEFAGRVVDNRGFGDRLGRKLEAAGIPLRAAEWVVLVVASVLAGGAILFLVSSGNPVGLVIGLIIGGVVPGLVLSFRRSRRERAFLEVLPETLGLMASGLRAGYSMPQAMDSVSREGQEPLKSEFNRALVEARLGVPPEDAMEGIADRMDSKDFRWVVMAIRIQREVGGNLAELLDTVSKTLRERARLKRQVDVLSAEGRLSAWIIGGLPVLFAIYLLLTQPGYLAVLYTDPLGIALAILALVVFGIGVLGLRWAVKVDV